MEEEMSESEFRVKLLEVLARIAVAVETLRDAIASDDDEIASEESE